jgi:hypothetical protein
MKQAIKTYNYIEKKYKFSKFFPIDLKDPLNRKNKFLIKSAKMPVENINLFWNCRFDKGRLKSFVSWFLNSYGEKKTIELLEQLKYLGFGYATKAGISLGIDDLKIPPLKYELLNQAEFQILKGTEKYKKAQITEVERIQRLIDVWNQTSEFLKQEVIRYFEITDIFNPVYMMAFSGARGNISQVRQLVGMRGLMSDPQGNIIDFPIQSNFREGLTLTEYIISTYGARKGIVDTALRTATAGYLTRRLVDVAQHVIISQFDCGTTRGIFLFDMKEGVKTIYSFQNRLIGRVLARDIIHPNNNSLCLGYRNQEINSSLAASIVKITKKAFVRSPLTCETHLYVCQLCYGWSLASSKLVSIGEAVGVIAAQSIGEPGTQLTMRTFHTGGVFAGGLTNFIKAPYDGFIEYLGTIPGTCIRTPHGDIGFLTKAKGSFIIKEKKSQNKDFRIIKEIVARSDVYTIPGYAILFARNKEQVFKRNIIAQFSETLQNLTPKGYAEQTVYTQLEGQVSFFQIDLLERKNEKLLEDIVWTAMDWSKIWVLSGKIYYDGLGLNSFLSKGDFITKDSIFQKIYWHNLNSCFLDMSITLEKNKNFQFKQNKRKQFINVQVKMANNKRVQKNFLISFLNSKKEDYLNSLHLKNLQLTSKSKSLFNKRKTEKKIYKYSITIKNLFLNSLKFNREVKVKIGKNQRLLKNKQMNLGLNQRFKPRANHILNEKNCKDKSKISLTKQSFLAKLRFAKKKNVVFRFSLNQRFKPKESKISLNILLKNNNFNPYIYPYRTKTSFFLFKKMNRINFLSFYIKFMMSKKKKKNLFFYSNNNNIKNLKIKQKIIKKRINPFVFKYLIPNYFRKKIMKNKVFTMPLIDKNKIFLNQPHSSIFKINNFKNNNKKASSFISKKNKQLCSLTLNHKKIKLNNNFSKVNNLKNKKKIFDTFHARNDVSSLSAAKRSRKKTKFFKDNKIVNFSYFKFNKKNMKSIFISSSSNNSNNINHIKASYSMKKSLLTLPIKNIFFQKLGYIFSIKRKISSNLPIYQDKFDFILSFFSLTQENMTIYSYNTNDPGKHKGKVSFGNTLMFSPFPKIAFRWFPFEYKTFENGIFVWSKNFLSYSIKSKILSKNKISELDLKTKDFMNRQNPDLHIKNYYFIQKKRWVYVDGIFKKNNKKNITSFMAFNYSSSLKNIKPQNNYIPLAEILTYNKTINKNLIIKTKDSVLNEFIEEQTKNNKNFVKKQNFIKFRYNLTLNQKFQNLVTKKHLKKLLFFNKSLKNNNIPIFDFISKFSKFSVYKQDFYFIPQENSRFNIWNKLEMANFDLPSVVITDNNKSKISSKRQFKLKSSILTQTKGKKDQEINSYFASNVYLSNRQGFKKCLSPNISGFVQIYCSSKNKPLMPFISFSKGYFKKSFPSFSISCLSPSLFCEGANEIKDFKKKNVNKKIKPLTLKNKKRKWLFNKKNIFDKKALEIKDFNLPSVVIADNNKSSIQSLNQGFKPEAKGKKDQKNQSFFEQNSYTIKEKALYKMDSTIRNKMIHNILYKLCLKKKNKGKKMKIEDNKLFDVFEKQHFSSSSLRNAKRMQRKRSKEQQSSKWPILTKSQFELKIQTKGKPVVKKENHQTNKKILIAQLKNQSLFFSCLPFNLKSSISSKRKKNQPPPVFSNKNQIKKGFFLEKAQVERVTKPGWVYCLIDPNFLYIKNVHQCFINPGKTTIHDICFEQNKIYIENIYLVNESLKNKDQKNKTIKIDHHIYTNKNCRFFDGLISTKIFEQKHIPCQPVLKSSISKEVEIEDFKLKSTILTKSQFESSIQSLNQGFKPEAKGKKDQKKNSVNIFLLFRPVHHKILPNSQLFKTYLYCNKKNFYHNFSILFYKDFHSKSLNQQNSDKKILSKYPSLDFQIKEVSPFNLAYKKSIFKKDFGKKGQTSKNNQIKLKMAKHLKGNKDITQKSEILHTNQSKTSFLNNNNNNNKLLENQNGLEIKDFKTNRRFASKFFEEQSFSKRNHEKFQNIPIIPTKTKFHLKIKNKYRHVLKKGRFNIIVKPYSLKKHRTEKKFKSYFFKNIFYSAYKYHSFSLELNKSKSLGFDYGFNIPIFNLKSSNLNLNLLNIQKIIKNKKNNFLKENKLEIGHFTPLHKTKFCEKTKFFLQLRYAKERNRRFQEKQRFSSLPLSLQSSKGATLSEEQKKEYHFNKIFLKLIEKNNIQKQLFSLPSFSKKNHLKIKKNVPFFSSQREENKVNNKINQKLILYNNNNNNNNNYNNLDMFFSFFYIYKMQILEWAYAKKEAYFCFNNYPLIKGSKNNFLPLLLRSSKETSFCEETKFRANMNKKASFSLLFPPFENSFLLYKAYNKVLANEIYASTAIFCPYEGEVLETHNKKWWDSFSEIGLKHKKNDIKYHLFLTKKDIFSNSLELNPLEKAILNFPTNGSKRPNIFSFLPLRYHSLLNNSKQIISIKLLENLQLPHDMWDRKKSDKTSYNISNFVTKYQNKLYKLNGLYIGKSFGRKGQSHLDLGKFLLKGDNIYYNKRVNKTGQIIHLSAKKISLRNAQPFLLSPKAILHVHQGEFIHRNTPIITLPFDTLTSGDIVQGIPKVEQYLEARTTQNGRFFLYSLPVLQKAIFERYRSKLPLDQAVAQSFLKIQQIIVDGVQRVYRSQGVSIAEKHLEVIVKQMTSKVQIIHGGQTGFFPGELVDLDIVENVNKFLMVKIRYEPVVLGITRASLEAESFLSAASFQQTTKILAKASLSKKKDYLKGLKENLLVGNLIPAGTGFMNSYL